MASLATFSLNGTEYQISDENMDMATLKDLLKKVLDPENNPALDALCNRNSDNDDWFETLLEKYTDSLGGISHANLQENDDEELLQSL